MNFFNSAQIYQPLNMYKKVQSVYFFLFIFVCMFYLIFILKFWKKNELFNIGRVQRIIIPFL
jgi:hypothetical protein